MLKPYVSALGIAFLATAARADAWGGPLVPVPAAALPDVAAGRAVVILVHGNNYELETAGREANEVRARLLAAGGFARSLSAHCGVK